MVWPFLLLGYCITAVYNLRAGAAFLICLILVQGVKYTQFHLDQMAFFAIYSCVGVMVFLFFDRMSGVAILACGVIYGLHLFGVIPHRPKMIAAEVALFAGMVASVFGGPSGGFFTHSGGTFGAGMPSVDPRWQGVLQSIMARG